jgi:hypothetical protein
VQLPLIKQVFRLTPCKQQLNGVQFVKTVTSNMNTQALQLVTVDHVDGNSLRSVFAIAAHSGIAVGDRWTLSSIANGQAADPREVYECAVVKVGDDGVSVQLSTVRTSSVEIGRALCAEFSNHIVK